MSRKYDTIARPTPLRAAFKTTGSAIAFVGSVVAFAVTWGLLSTDQASAIDALLAAVPGLIGLGTALLAAFGVVAKSEPQVTPVEAPQDDQGNRLTPAGT